MMTGRVYKIWIENLQTGFPVEGSLQQELALDTYSSWRFVLRNWLDTKLATWLKSGHGSGTWLLLPKGLHIMYWIDNHDAINVDVRLMKLKSSITIYHTRSYDQHNLSFNSTFWFISGFIPDHSFATAPRPHVSSFCKYTIMLTILCTRCVEY